MPALIAIIAKLMAIVNAVLDVFCSATWTAAGGACNVQGIVTNITPCGEAIVTYATQLVYFVMQLGGQLLPALGAVEL
jgi:hypothetical protein